MQLNTVTSHLSDFKGTVEKKSVIETRISKVPSKYINI